MEETTQIKKERDFWKANFERRVKMDKINRWINLIGTLIIFLILMVALLKKLF